VMPPVGCAIELAIWIMVLGWLVDERWDLFGRIHARHACQFSRMPTANLERICTHKIPIHR
jgi:hypothetical protein